MLELARDFSETEEVLVAVAGAFVEGGVSGTVVKTTDGIGEEALVLSGLAGLWPSWVRSTAAGEWVRVSTRAGVRALLGRAFGVLGQTWADEGRGEEALPLGVI